MEHFDRREKELRNKKVAIVKKKWRINLGERVGNEEEVSELFSNIDMNLNFKNFYKNGKERM